MSKNEHVFLDYGMYICILVCSEKRHAQKFKIQGMFIIISSEHAQKKEKKYACLETLDFRHVRAHFWHIFAYLHISLYSGHVQKTEK
jgi:hypothetical protein